MLVLVLKYKYRSVPSIHNPQRREMITIIFNATRLGLQLLNLHDLTEANNHHKQKHNVLKTFDANTPLPSIYSMFGLTIGT